MKRPHRERRIIAALLALLALAGVWFVGDTAREPAPQTALPGVAGGCLYANFPGAYQPIMCVPSR